MTDQRIERVVIVGGGTAGWMAAAVLSKAFGRLLNIELIESDQIGTVGVGEATIPQIRLLLALLGMDEDECLRNTQGTIKLGIEFHNWGKPGERYMHAFGSIGRSLSMLTFQHYWLKSHLQGEGGSLWDYSFGYQAAIANRFARTGPLGESGMEGLAYAYHFDATLFAAWLRKFCESAGVIRREGKVVDTTLRADDGFIESVTLEGGTMVAGDLFIDCSGFRGLLIEDALRTGYDDWTRWLPCDRAGAVPCASVEPLTPYTQAIARPCGWQWRIPLQHRIGNGHVYCSDFMSDDEASSILLQNLVGEPGGEPRLLRFTTGMRKQVWNRNCVALGLASGFMEPLESTSIHLVQTGLSRLINLFPDSGFNPDNIAEYNRQSRFEFERIRDFLILHYHLNQRSDSDFWISRREMAVPESLQRKMGMFRGSGRIYRDADELFAEVAWLQVMLGQGIEPQAYHPLADTLSDRQRREFLANLKTIIQQAVARLPSHRQFVDANFSAGQ
jgi:tryptophan halogenase